MAIVRWRTTIRVPLTRLVSVPAHDGAYGHVVRRGMWQAERPLETKFSLTGLLAGNYLIKLSCQWQCNTEYAADTGLRADRYEAAVKLRYFTTIGETDTISIDGLGMRDLGKDIENLFQLRCFYSTAVILNIDLQVPDSRINTKHFV